MCCNQNYINNLMVLNEVYEFLNEKLFDSELMKPVITIQQDKTGKAYGWFTAYEAWQDDKTGSPEINLTANYLNRPSIEIIGTLLHEMCHLYAYEHKLKDTSARGVYHNACFKKIADDHGLVLEHTKYGWTGHGLTEEVTQLIEPLIPRLQTLKRIVATASRRKNTTRKYVCPLCGMFVRASTDVNVSCTDCGEEMEKES